MQGNSDVSAVETSKYRIEEILNDEISLIGD